VLEGLNFISMELKVKIDEWEEVERRAEGVKGAFREVAKVGSILFNIVKNMCLIDAMYFFSLEQFEWFFHLALL